jgi:prepilin-type N-terminal cleavage/methylation domain-containing protein
MAGQRGMGLAECMAALLILALGAVAGMELVALSTWSGDALQRAAAANTLLAGRMEELLALPYDHPTLEPGGSLSLPRPGYSEVVTLDGREWLVCRQVALEAGGRKLVALAVHRAGEGGRRPGARLFAWVVR